MNTMGRRGVAQHVAPTESPWRERRHIAFEQRGQHAQQFVEGMRRRPEHHLLAQRKRRRQPGVVAVAPRYGVELVALELRRQVDLQHRGDLAG
jgi:hypothetical protein